MANRRIGNCDADVLKGGIPLDASLDGCRGRRAVIERKRCDPQWRFTMMKQLIGLWRDTWWLWTAFLVMTLVFSFVVGKFFLLLLPCLPVPYVYFAINRYDTDGKEKPDLGS